MRPEYVKRSDLERLIKVWENEREHYLRRLGYSFAESAGAASIFDRCITSLRAAFGDTVEPRGAVPNKPTPPPEPPPGPPSVEVKGVFGTLFDTFAWRWW